MSVYLMSLTALIAQNCEIQNTLRFDDLLKFQRVNNGHSQHKGLSRIFRTNWKKLVIITVLGISCYFYFQSLSAKVNFSEISKRLDKIRSAKTQNEKAEIFSRFIAAIKELRTNFLKESGGSNTVSFYFKSFR